MNHYENFPVASLLLPRNLRRPVHDIYRFARTADDIADEGDAPDAKRLAYLAAYRGELHAIGADRMRPVQGSCELAKVFGPLAVTISRHQLPITPFYDLLSAFEQDVIQSRYPDFRSLQDYSRRSANPVGLLMLHLHQAASATNIVMSDAICTGLQLVNFAQDVQSDWRRGRVYLPLDELDRYGVGENDLAARRLGSAWTGLMSLQVQRARALLHSGAPLARQLAGRVGFELRLVVQGGLRILERIENNHYDVFMNRPELNKRDWSIMFWRAMARYDA